jgi:hypothetical protein
MTLAKAVIFDIDGTLAKRVTDRSPYDMTRVGEDTPHTPVLAVLEALGAHGYQILYCSGRFEAGRAATVQWLREHTVFWDSPLFMRPDGDFGPDSKLKLNLYREHIEPRWDVQMVFDDRDRVVGMWRLELGLPCLQVDYGDF